METTKSHFYDNIVYFFVYKIEYHCDYLYFKERERNIIFFWESKNLFVILIEHCVRYWFAINLESFGDVYKVGGCEESYFFPKFFVEYLGDHLANTSFSITACNMKYIKSILRWPYMGKKFEYSFFATFHTSWCQWHHKVNVCMIFFDNHKNEIMCIMQLLFVRLLLLLLHVGKLFLIAYILFLFQLVWE